MKAQIEIFVLFVCLKKIIIRIYVFFMVIHKLYNQSDEKRHDV